MTEEQQERYYPPLEITKIRQVKKIYETTEGFFTDPKCPYPQDIKDLFAGVQKETAMSIDSLISDKNILIRIADLQSKLDIVGKNIQNSDNSSEKNTYFRISMAILKDLVEMRMKMSNIVMVSQFYNEVLTIMNDILDKDQRHEVLTRLGQFMTDDKKTEMLSMSNTMEAIKE